jgi:hypothetical protein
MKSFHKGWGAALIAALVWSSWLAPASADPPPLLPIQGYLTDSASAPLDGVYQIRFRLYDADTAGTSLFEETLDVTVADGFFTVYLGDTVALDLALFRDNSDIFLGIRVGTDAEGAPRLQLASTGFASLAAFCGDADTVGGLEPDDLQSRVVGTCGANQFMQSIDAAGTVVCGSAPAETDPAVGAQTAGRWCTSDGSTVTCTQTAPVTAEVDPQVGALTAGRWCTTDGTSITCAQNPPVTAEVDPQVGTLGAGSWCTSDGNAVNCGQAAPVLAESDPQVGASLVTSAVPRWDGTALNPGRIFDTGTLVGINNNAPSEELDVIGDVEVTSNYRFSPARTYYTYLGPSAFNPMSAADLDDWVESSAGFGYMSDADGASTGQSLMTADLALPEDATVSTVQCYYTDTSTTDGIGYVTNIPSLGSLQSWSTFSLLRRGLGVATTESILSANLTTTAAATTTANPTSSGWADSTVTAGTDVIDNSAYDYYLYVGWYVSNDATSALRFWGCRVSYTVTHLALP